MEGKVKSAFDKIAAGLEDAIAFAGGHAARGRVATVDVRAVRAATRLTQGAFARTYRFPVGTVRDWEQMRRQPDTGSATLLKMSWTADWPFPTTTFAFAVLLTLVGCAKSAEPRDPQSQNDLAEEAIPFV